MTKVREIASAIESYAPLGLQESYDNAGLQVGDPEMTVSAVLLCLDVTEETLREARKRECNMIVSHHPLIFHGLKQLTGADAIQRIAIEALKSGIAIYSAHTNLDIAREGVSYEMARMLSLRELRPLEPHEGMEGAGLGIVGETEPTPKLEFLRRVKETFKVKDLKYSGQSPQIVVRKVALCGGSGASLIKDAVGAGADCYITGDVKYHDFTTYGERLILADIGHYESELCSRRIFSRVIREAHPGCVTYISETEMNPVKYM
ncbi:MAG: Nif3-like dinuclear metal center hexameric protein [Clostridium sp.]|nr:Nif3-like dinuclear metal center hexameric protein [Prevotella sp.]MCM1429498.1 Nif3-like dinuclear metal center hexameric protein [Clostridium sp.]MCM1476114.1 Nif3-like dinuclear metal center hexameric protein [Muribaculaceae bacterium]